MKPEILTKPSPQGLFKVICEKLLSSLCIVRDDKIIFSNDSFKNKIGNSLFLDDLLTDSEGKKISKKLQKNLTTFIVKAKNSNTFKKVFYHKYDKNHSFLLLREDNSIIKQTITELQRLSLEGEFAVRTYHEFSNFLMVAMCHLDDLQNKTQKEEKAEESLEAIANFNREYYISPLNSTSLMNYNDQEIIKKIRKCLREAANLTREKLKVFQLPAETVGDINSFLNNCITDCKSIYKDVNFINTTKNLKSKLLIKETYLRQIILNLIKNAAEAIKKDKKVIEINAKNHYQQEDQIFPFDFFGKIGNYYKIQIKDNGSGISKENLKNLFVRFASTKQLGTGIGLTIIQSLLKKIGGFLIVNTKEGEGSEFNIFIPVDDSHRKKKTILIVEDCSIIRTKIIEFCKELNYKAIGVPGAEEMKKVNFNKISIVIMDKNLPNNYDGHQLIEEYKEKYPKIKYISISGFDNKSSKYYSLHKPFSKKELEALLNRLMVHVI